MPSLLGSRRRIYRFLLIGTLCFGVQYAIMRLLFAIGLSWPVANVVGFIASAQLNFALSNAVTWGDRRWSGTALWLRWLSYCATCLLSLAVNTVVFAVSYRSVGSLPAAASAVAAATTATYLLCNLVVFRAVGPPRRARETAPDATVAPAGMMAGDAR